MKKGKSIERLLKCTGVEELINLDDGDVFITTIIRERKMDIFNGLKTRLFDNLNQLDKHLADVLNSKKRRFQERLYENILNYVIFAPLLDSIHDRKQSDSLVSSLIGSGLRTVGGVVRGGSKPPTFQTLRKAMEYYESLGGVNHLSKKGGNLLRNVGEKMSGERPTLYRVIKRTVLGLNPFLKHLPHEMKNEMKNKHHLVGIAHALLRLYNGGHNSGFHFIQFLYRYTFPVYGTKIRDPKLPNFYKRIWISAMAKFFLQNHPNEEEPIFIDNCIRKQTEFEDMFKDSFYRNIHLKKSKVSESSETEKVFMLVYRRSKLVELRKMRRERTVSMRIEHQEREDILQQEREEEAKVIEMNRQLEAETEEEEEEEGERRRNIGGGGGGGNDSLGVFMDEDKMNLWGSIHEDEDDKKKGKPTKTAQEEVRSPMSEEMKRHEMLKYQSRTKMLRKTKRKIRKDKRMSVLDLLKEEDEEEDIFD